MSVNLLNDKELNDYLIDLVWGERGMPIILDGQSQENMMNANYIEQNKDAIVRSILTQYMKHRIRAYLTESEDYPFLTPVSKRADLPDWATRALDAGQKVYSFDAAKMTGQMRHDLTTIRDFLYSAAESYVDKTVIAIKENIQKDKKKLPKVRLDYLKTSNEYNTFEKTLAQAEKWHEHMAQLAAKKEKNEQMYKASLAGTQFIMDLPNGMRAYQLMTPQALDFESEYMGHCVGRGGYDKDVTNGSVKIYSIRDNNGEPHATLEVRGQNVFQCKGKGNKTPVQRYIPAVQHFVEAQKLEIKHDMKNIGLINQDGKYYSIYDLPNGFVVHGDLDLSDMDLADVNLNIKVTGTLNLAGAKNIKLHPKTDFSGTKDVNLSDTDLSGVREIRWPSEKIILRECKNLPPVLDFSGTRAVDLSYTDLSGVREIRWPSEEMYFRGCKNLPPVLDFSITKAAILIYPDLSDVREIKGSTKEICLSYCTNLPPVLDFNRTKEGEISHTDLSGVREIKWPSEKIKISECENLPPVLDFSTTKAATLTYTDLSGVREIKCSTKWISISSCKNLPPVLDFSGTKDVYLNFNDLSGVREIKWPSEKIDLSGSKNLPPVLDFSITKDVILTYADLSGVREIKWPSEKIKISGCKNLPPVLDFSTIKGVYLGEADLSGVREIKWPDNGQILDPDKNRWPEHLRKSYDLWRAKMIVKNYSKETAKQNIPKHITSNGRLV